MNTLESFMTQDVKFAYFVHDLADPAVSKRVRMLSAAACKVQLFGFSRVTPPEHEVANVKATCLGITKDTKLVARGVSVLKTLASVFFWGRALRGVDVFFARNLESLLIAWLGRLIFAPQAKLVYELLDIHSSMLGRGHASHILRSIEGFLIRRSCSIVISSPAFEENYLRVFHPNHPQTILVENKVLLLEKVSSVAPPAHTCHSEGQPWRLGWFGAIRCRESLLLLIEVAEKYPGLLEVSIRGKIIYALIPDFDQLIKRTQSISYLGAYRSPDDLMKIYGEVDFIWSIDFYEKGLNSSWLLPNRLYEGCLHGAVPIGQEGVETTKWMAKNGVGMALASPFEKTLPEFLESMTTERFLLLKSQVGELKRDLLVFSKDDCREMVRRMLSD